MPGCPDIPNAPKGFQIYFNTGGPTLAEALSDKKLVRKNGHNLVICIGWKEVNLEVMRTMGAEAGFGLNSGFALLVVLFILLIIIGASWVY